MMCGDKQAIMFLAILVFILVAGVCANENGHHHGEHGHDHHHGDHGSGSGDCELDDSLVDLIKSFGLAVLGKDQESAHDVQPTEDHAHLNVQAIIDELFHPSSTPRPTTTTSPPSSPSGPLPIKDHHLGWDASPTDLVMTNSILEPVFKRKTHNFGSTTTKPVYLTETHYYLSEDFNQEEDDHFSPLQSRDGKSLDLNLDVNQLIDKPILPVVDTRLANFLHTRAKRPRTQRRRKMKEDNTRNKSPTPGPLKFKQQTPPPFLIRFVTDKTDDRQSGREEEGDIDDRGGGEGDTEERRGVIEAVEEDGTLWRSDERSHHSQISDHHIPTTGQNRDHQIPPTTSTPQSLPPSSLQPPRTSQLQESITQTHIRRQQEETFLKKEVDVTNKHNKPTLERLVEAIFSLPQDKRHPVQQTKVKHISDKNQQVLPPENQHSFKDSQKDRRPQIKALQKQNHARRTGKQGRNRRKFTSHQHFDVVRKGKSNEPGLGGFRVQMLRPDCRDKLGGLHADISSGCQHFFMCHEGGRSGKFSCPRGTLFSQTLGVCDWSAKVECGLPSP